MRQKEFPLYALLDQIIVAAESGLHLIALGMAVAVPDMCAALESENGRATQKSYKEWCGKYLCTREFSMLTGEDLYSMRCGVLHQGRFGGLAHSFERVLFVPPGPVSMTDCMINDAYIYGVVEFCKNLCNAARRWHEVESSNPIVVKNATRMMQYHPDGIPPYVGGFLVIG